MATTLVRVIEQTETECLILVANATTGRVQILTSPDLPFMRIGDNVVITDPDSVGGTTEPKIGEIKVRKLVRKE